MKDIAVAGSGDLVEKLIDALLPKRNITAVVLSPKMPAEGLASMKAFCTQRGIPVQYGFDGIKADVFLTPNYPVLISGEFSGNHLCVNVHFSLLPKYRGFHPVQCALLNDEPVVGYTVHRVDAGMDSGPIYFQEQFKVLDSDNIHTLNEKMSDHLTANFAIYLDAILADGKQPVPQDGTQAIWGGRRRPEDGLIDWRQPSRHIFNLVRAVCPPYYPGAYTYWKDKKVVIVEAKEHLARPYRHIPGQVVDAASGLGLLVKTGDTLVWVRRIQVDSVEGPAEEIIGRPIGLRFSTQPEI